MASRRPLCSFAEFVRRGIVLVEDSASTDLRPIELYPLQQEFIKEVWDTYGKDGRRRYRRAVFSTVKKGGKTSFVALQCVYHLLFDTTERRREIVSISGDQDQARLIMRLGAEMIRRSPALSGFGIQLLRDQILYVDEDGEEHTWTVLASDAVTAHGLNPSVVTVDEVHGLDSVRGYALLEAVALGPQRWHPVMLFTTYAGLKSAQVKGHPLWDLYQAGLQGSDPSLYFVWRTGLDAYNDFPSDFIRPGYLEQQRHALTEARWRRIHLNEWGSADEGGFLSDVEIARAVDPSLVVPERNGIPTVLAVDYGRVRDHTALVACQRHPVTGKVAVVHAETLKGSPALPVPVSAVERAVRDVCARLNVARIILDPYQTVGMAERLADMLGYFQYDAREGEDAPRVDRAIVLQTFTPSYVNRLATSLLSLFRDSGIAIPGDDPGCQELIDQLGAVVSKETYYGIRIDSGRGSGVRAHDDLVIALGMSALAVAARGPYIELPEFGCQLDRFMGHDSRAFYGRNCFLHKPSGGRAWPLNGGRLVQKHTCLSCPGWLTLQAAWHQAQAAGETIDIEEFNRTRIFRRPKAIVVDELPVFMR